MSENRYFTNKIEIKVAKLYLFFLPFRMIMPFEWLQQVIGPLANYFDLLFHLFGLALWLRNEGGFYFNPINRPLYKQLKYSIIYLNISSVVMACVMYAIYGNYYGHSPFWGVVPMILFYFHYLFMFLYNIRVFTLLDYKTMVNTIAKTCTALLILGYLQVGAMLGPLAGVYDVFAQIFGGLVTSENLLKLSLTGTEGASAGSLLGVFVWPFLLARILHGDKRSTYELILWLIPLYFTHSSTALLLFALDFCLFLYLMNRHSLNNRAFLRKILSFASVAGIAILLISMSNLITDDVAEELNYLLLEKASDSDNGSTAARSVPFIIGMGCFKEMPILGVGNGLQGYFYDKYFPIEFLKYPSMDFFYDKRHDGIGNGGTFFSGYFSGYGIIGIIVLIGIIINIRKTYLNRKNNLGVFREMFIIGAICIIPNGFQGDFYSLYYIWFVLSIPFMFFSQDEISN